MPLSDTTSDIEVDNSRILINLAIVVSIMLILCYVVPYMYKMFEDSTLNVFTLTSWNYKFVRYIVTT